MDSRTAQPSPNPIKEQVRAQFDTYLQVIPGPMPTLQLQRFIIECHGTGHVQTSMIACDNSSSEVCLGMKIWTLYKIAILILDPLIPTEVHIGLS
jgi:hypothetical protein